SHNTTGFPFIYLPLTSHFLIKSPLSQVVGISPLTQDTVHPVRNTTTKVEYKDKKLLNHTGNTSKEFISDTPNTENIKFPIPKIVPAWLERWIVVPEVAGSNPVFHPKS
ncbi:MAG: hypothetical protein R6U65_02985, partial [Perlabentimonas sp.]